MVSANNLDDEYSETGRDPDSDLLRGLVLPIMTTCTLVVFGFIVAGVIGVVLTTIGHLFGQ
jgi:hypothetical protein